MLSLLGETYDKDSVNAYRHDGFAVFKNIDGLQAEKIKTEFP